MSDEKKVVYAADRFRRVPEPQHQAEPGPALLESDDMEEPEEPRGAEVFSFPGNVASIPNEPSRENRRGIHAVERADPLLLERGGRGISLRTLARISHEGLLDGILGDALVRGEENQRKLTKLQALEQALRSLHGLGPRHAHNITIRRETLKADETESLAERFWNTTERDCTSGPAWVDALLDELEHRGFFDIDPGFPTPPESAPPSITSEDGVANSEHSDFPRSPGRRHRPHPRRKK